ncbi:unnamed protein product [Spodoptera exigua]|nr:unnamed protein product [Spodoptera exigua]
MKYTNKQHQNTTRACASMHSLNTNAIRPISTSSTHAALTTLHLAYGCTQIHVQSSIRKQSEKKVFPNRLLPPITTVRVFYLCEIITKFYPVGEKIDLSIAV